MNHTHIHNTTSIINKRKGAREVLYSLSLVDTRTRINKNLALLNKYDIGQLNMKKSINWDNNKNDIKNYSIHENKD